jgi:mannan endo-1,4-beta-mannosidase
MGMSLKRGLASLLLASVMLFTNSSQAKELPSFSGTNQYYLFYKSHNMVDKVFADSQSLGLTVIRTWAFCEGASHDGYCFQPRPYEYHEPTFKQLDYAIAKAGQSGIKLILTLANNWSDFGGIPQYLNWYGLNNHDDFYRDQRVKDTYKAYIKQVINRVNTITGVPYKDDPTILAWELMNEPRSYDLPVFYAWVDEMSNYIKELDPNHLRSTGSEGAISSDVYQTHKSDAVDFISFHLYPNWWGFDRERSKQYIREHVKIAREMGKPIFLGEFGIDKQQRRSVYQEWYQILKEEKVEGVAFWLLSSEQDDGSLYPDYDGFTVYYPESSDVIDIIKGYSDYVHIKGIQ